MKRLTVLIVLLLVVVGAAAMPAAARQDERYWPTDGWRTSTPEEQGMNSSKLADLFAYMARRGFNMRSMLIIRNGYVVAEMVQYPYSPDMLHELRSATKSFTGTLVGIALGQGDIRSLDQPVVGFFPDRTAAHLDDRKRALTLENLLTMSGGFEWGDGTMGGDFVPFYEMYKSPDWTQFMLDRAIVTNPGTRFEYNSGGAHLVSAILQQAAGQPTEAFAAEHLFEPLGIRQWFWVSDPQGIAWGCSGLSLTPRDMAKLGYLYLNNGVWDGQPILPADWVTAATQQQIQAGPTMLSDGYGYLWWVDQNGYFMALGYGGEDIIVVPDENLIVVTVAALNWGEFEAPEWLLNDYILPAVESDDPLPPNPDGMAVLQAQLDAWAHPAAQPITPLPETAAAASGRTLRFGENSLGWHTGAFGFEAGSSEARIVVDGSLTLSVGLDGIYRVNALAGSSMALKGEWTDADTFTISAQALSAPQNYAIRVTFGEDGVRISLFDRGMGTTEFITGTWLD